MRSRSKEARARALPRRAFAVAGVALLTLAASAAAGGKGKTPWSELRKVAPGPARAIGDYSNGCVQGAEALEPKGSGFRLMRPERHRHFGHPALVQFIERLGQSLQTAELAPLAVGDLGQPRGGPAPSGHASHQTGLDVDLWFTPADAPGDQISMVAEQGGAVTDAFTAREITLLRLASEDPVVARIFVNPAIKQAVCERTPPSERKWLNKLRPWWGHDSHFHVRLGCPEGSPECTSQAPVPKGDGCAELSWWFDPAKQKDRSEGVRKYAKRIKSKPALPRACSALLPR